MGAVEKRKVTRFPPNKKPRLFKEKGWDYLRSNTLPRCSKADSTFSQSSQKLQKVLIALQLQFFSYDFSTLSDSTFSRVAISLLTHLLIHPPTKVLSISFNPPITATPVFDELRSGRRRSRVATSTHRGEGRTKIFVSFRLFRGEQKEPVYRSGNRGSDRPDGIDRPVAPRSVPRRWGWDTPATIRAVLAR